MFTRSFLVVVSSVIVVPAWASAVPENLVLYWQFNEGQGTVAKDLSGNGNDGTLEGGALWVPGMLRGALAFNGANAVVRGPHLPFNSRSFTHAMWVNPALSASAQAVFSQYQASTANQGLHYRLLGDGGIKMGFYSNDLDMPAGTLTANTWYHLTFWYDLGNQNRRIYINGELKAEGSAPPYLGTAGDTLVGTFRRPDRPDRVPEWFDGMIDDVQLYDRVLADEEIQQIMLGLTDPALAYDSSPADGSTDVPRDAALSWSAGDSAVAHDVYFGTALEDVNDASRANPGNVLVSEGQETTAYDPADPLDFGTTYYWRIDEVKGAPDNTVSKGEVWSFTTEPYGYPITDLTVRASGEETTSPAIRTIDGSGLDDLDQHDVGLETMWITSGGTPAWIQYTFDKAYKLHELWVWNSNFDLEPSMGLGARNVVIEWSTDGETWTAFENSPEFAQGTGYADYLANTVVDLGEVTARHVKLTITSTWGDTGMVSLSEVRFYYKPLQAFGPDPEDGATEVGVEPTLNWRPGREATSHIVYLSEDATTVAEGTAAARTVTDHGYAPSSLNLATEYFWRVDEVGDSGTYAGNVWSFTTEAYVVVDDFESYNDDDHRLYDLWIDGVTNGTGSYVGYENANHGTFGETVVVHGGSQSMPVSYNNAKLPYYSEVERTFDSAQNWTAHGADALRLYFQGVATNSSQPLYVTVKDNSRSQTVAHSNAAATTATEWQEWTIPLSEFSSANVRLTAVKALAIGVGNKSAPTAGGTGIVYIDDIAIGVVQQ
ncbi:MAG: Ig-like domain-containing protein [Phycisphaerae bacterium]|nr:Ig-like domain-containing protein [Phycisphaerae bacterium]